jgi:peptidoglycan/xylan/chitin deacetylase (PgdA/CDA1 family)
LSQKIDAMVESTLELLESSNIFASFFVVGWLAEKNPNLIRKIADNGHEIASHGYWHAEVFRQSPAEFSEDIKRAKTCQEAAVGQEVYGFRAPGYSIGRCEE